MKSHSIRGAWILLCAITATAQQFNYINSWTKPTSGYWEESYWTYGLPSQPDYAHVNFNSPGWKALAIGSSTVRDHPNSLRLSSLVVRSPSNSFNTFMLNYAGLQTPLQIAGAFTLGDNSAFLTLASALRVGDQFFIDGTVNHGAQSDVSATTIHVGVFDRGIYNLSNGVLTAGTLDVGDWFNTHPRCAFTQEGGSNRLGRLELWTADYFMLAGDLRADTINIAGEVGGLFRQGGGRVAARTNVAVGSPVGSGFGQYILAGGTLTAPQLEVGTQLSSYWRTDGLFEQHGGSNFVGALRVGDFGSHQPDYVRSGRYDLIGGSLVTSNTSIGVALPGFYQLGGKHTVHGPLTIRGYRHDSPSAGATDFYGHYGLHGGNLSARSIHVRLAGIQHSSGTNEVSGDLVLEPEQFAGSWYSLDGGRVVTSNTIIFPSRSGRFDVRSGVHEVRGRLQLHGSETQTLSYMLWGGELFVRDIQVSTNAELRHQAGTIHHTGALTLEGGAWFAAAPMDQRLGVLKLNASRVESAIFGGENSTIRFAGSAAAMWAAGSRLVINGWSGWPRVFFGTNSAGLTAQQLSQIRFRDGMIDHAAHIRATGEIIPVPNDVFLASLRNGNQMILQWPADYGFVLETATNIAGPFVPISGTSPYTNHVASGTRQFFRLRR